MSLDKYRDRVEELARRRKGEPIFNGSLEHAAIIVETMFANSSHSVQILSGKLNARVYGRDDVVEQAKLFLADANHTVRILLEENRKEDLSDHPFFDEFAEYQNLEVRVVPADWQNTYDFHFLVMDSDSYRFEHDKTKHSAIAAFGDGPAAKNLARIFNDLWQQSEPVRLPQLVNQ